MKKDLLILILLIMPSFGLLMQKGYFTMHDDLQSMRQYQLDKCFQDGQIPCRWVPDMGYGYGYPLFNFYPPFPYLLGHVYRVLGFAYIDVIKLVGITGFIATAIFMYLLGRDLWGRGGGIISSLFYTYAPYHSVDYYVRGAVNEFWAMAFYPAIFWTTYRLIKENNSKWIPWVSLSVTGLMLSHNPMLMIFAPIFLAWILFWWWRFKSLKSLPKLTISAFLSLGLAAFFTLPVLLEQKYAHLETLVIGYFNYLAHYLDINQIFFNINWGYGSSELGPQDTMSFALGYLHWIVPAITLAASLFIKRLRQHLPLIFLLTFFVLGSLFLTHSKSTFIWQAVKPLEFLQFPWRFLTLSVFAASILSGSVTAMFSGKKQLIFLGVLASLVIGLNGNYFRPNKWFPTMTDSEKFSGKSWQLLVTSGIFDYLPIDAPMPPADPAGSDVNLLNGFGEVSTTAKKSNYQEYNINVFSPGAVAELQTYYFPGWKIWVNGQSRSIDPKRDPLLGRIQADLEMGENRVVARFTNTPIRTIANTLSIISWMSLLLFFIIKTKDRFFVRSVE